MELGNEEAHASTAAQARGETVQAPWPRPAQSHFRAVHEEWTAPSPLSDELRYGIDITVMLPIIRVVPRSGLLTPPLNRSGGGVFCCPPQEKFINSHRRYCLCINTMV